MATSNEDYTWLHQNRLFGLETHGKLKHNGKEFPFNKMTHGRFNYQHLAGMAPFKSGEISAVICGQTPEKRKFNFVTTTGLSDIHERNRGEADVFFIDDAITKVEPFYLEYNSEDIMQPWTAETWNIELFKNKKGELKFTPWGKVQHKKDYFFIKTDFRRIAGFWDGYLVDKEGKRTDIKRMQGYVVYNYVQA